MHRGGPPVGRCVLCGRRLIWQALGAYGARWNGGRAHTRCFRRIWASVDRLAPSHVIERGPDG